MFIDRYLKSVSNQLCRRNSKSKLVACRLQILLCIAILPCLFCACKYYLQKNLMIIKMTYELVCFLPHFEFSRALLAIFFTPTRLRIAKLLLGQLQILHFIFISFILNLGLLFALLNIAFMHAI